MINIQLGIIDPFDLTVIIIVLPTIIFLGIDYLKREKKDEEISSVFEKKISDKLEKEDFSYVENKCKMERLLRKFIFDKICERIKYTPESNKILEKIFMKVMIIYGKFKNQPEEWNMIIIVLKKRIKEYIDKYEIALTYPYDLAIQDDFKKFDNSFFKYFEEIISGKLKEPTNNIRQFMKKDHIFLASDNVPLASQEKINLIGKTINNALSLVKDNLKDDTTFTLEETNRRYLRDTLSIYHTLRQVDLSGAEIMLGQSLDIIQKGVDKYHFELLENIKNKADANKDFLENRFKT